MIYYISMKIDVHNSNLERGGTLFLSSQFEVSVALKWWRPICLAVSGDREHHKKYVGA